MRGDNDQKRQRWVPDVFGALIVVFFKGIAILVVTGILMVSTGMPFLSSLFVSLILVYGILWLLDW